QRASSEERHAKLEDIHKQIEAATANGQFDEAVVRPLANQQAQLMADDMVDHLRMHAKLYSLLTAEQRAKADQMMKSHGGDHHRGPGPGHGPPPPPPGF
ncbi:MAG TPA: Spy/CpxP family protein refolding chaperone, partial [Pyrinomonadaceae bacterium]